MTPHLQGHTAHHYSQSHQHGKNAYSVLSQALLCHACYVLSGKESQCS